MGFPLAVEWKTEAELALLVASGTSAFVALVRFACLQHCTREKGSSIAQMMVCDSNANSTIQIQLHTFRVHWVSLFLRLANAYVFDCRCMYRVIDMHDAGDVYNTMEIYHHDKLYSGVCHPASSSEYTAVDS